MKRNIFGLCTLVAFLANCHEQTKREADVNWDGIPDEITLETKDGEQNIYVLLGLDYNEERRLIYNIRSFSVYHEKGDNIKSLDAIDLNYDGWVDLRFTRKNQMGIEWCMYNKAKKYFLTDRFENPVFCD